MSVFKLQPKVDADVVATIEAHLERAKRGDIQAIAIVAMNGEGYTVEHVGYDTDHLISGCERMKFKAMCNAYEVHRS